MLCLLVNYNHFLLNILETNVNTKLHEKEIDRIRHQN